MTGRARRSVGRLAPAAVIALTEGETVYSCPLHPTPDDPIIAQA